MGVLTGSVCFPIEFGLISMCFLLYCNGYSIVEYFYICMWLLLVSNELTIGIWSYLYVISTGF